MSQGLIDEAQSRRYPQHTQPPYRLVPHPQPSVHVGQQHAAACVARVCGRKGQEHVGD